MAFCASSLSNRRPAPTALSDDLDAFQGFQGRFPDTPEQWFAGGGRCTTQLVLDTLLPTLSSPLPPLSQETRSKHDFGLSAAHDDAEQLWQRMPRSRKQTPELSVIEECSWQAPAQLPGPPPPPAYDAPSFEEIVEQRQMAARKTQHLPLPVKVPLPSDLRRSLELVNGSYTVKNTFINLPSPGHIRLEQRQAMSCPGSRLATPQSCRPWGGPLLPLTPSKLEMAESSAASTADTSDDIERTSDTIEGVNVPSLDDQRVQFQSSLLMPPPGLYAAVPSAFDLEGAQSEEELSAERHCVAASMTSDVEASEDDAAELPSIGSLGHALGTCKPCAFHWKPAGCSNGSGCTFCHLCDSSVKMERRKQKKVSIRAAKSAKAVKAAKAADIA
eukprot:TRINITY_DN79960_c0_g1_i1.p1 TRINITY_DN79960_c0_g1~~TRINITY_DN79960_c0_g1_i1.p1  ORF type:complete len:412 (-),score=74.95 TRINITY_DN79960_c0_g1_i1:387-1547(-)